MVTPVNGIQRQKPVLPIKERTYYDIYPSTNQDYAIKGIFVPPAKKPTSQPILENKKRISSMLHIVQNNRNDAQKEKKQSGYQTLIHNNR